MRFLYNEPAVLHHGALIIGDTHFGMEQKLREHGIYDNTLSDRIFERIKNLLKKTKARKIIIAGDVKDSITGFDEKADIALKKISKIAEVIIVKGNHDGGIEKYETPKIKICQPEGIEYFNVGIVHGHAWPNEKIMECRYLISAHQHPQVMFIDKTGKAHKEPVWLVVEADDRILKKYYKNRNKKIKLILMPAFNPLVGSTINKQKEKQLGPIFNKKLFKLNDALVFRLNGCLIGKLKILKSDLDGE